MALTRRVHTVSQDQGGTLSWPMFKMVLFTNSDERIFNNTPLVVIFLFQSLWFLVVWIQRLVITTLSG